MDDKEIIEGLKLAHYILSRTSHSDPRGPSEQQKERMELYRAAISRLQSLQWRPIEEAPKDKALVAIKDEKGNIFSPCNWSLSGEASEDGFWLWWQAEPEYLTEVNRPKSFIPLSAFNQEEE